MREETTSDQRRLCHEPSLISNDVVPHDEWCRLHAELWWGQAIRFPRQTLLRVELSREFAGDAEMAAAVSDCRCRGRSNPEAAPY